MLSDAVDIEASIYLESLGCTLALGDVYAKVRLEPAGEPSAEENGR